LAYDAKENGIIEDLGGDPAPAGLVAGEHRGVDDENLSPPRRQNRGARRAGGSPADDQDIGSFHASPFVERYSAARVHGTAFDPEGANTTWNNWSHPVRNVASEPAR
jgi:hypothetical protein